MTGVRGREIIREAWRNLTCGATRGLTGLVVFLLTIGAISGFVAFLLLDQARQAAKYREAGGATQVVSSTGMIDGAQCDALSTMPGITASGAVRAVTDTRLSVLPSTGLTTFEVTPGLAGVIGVHETQTTNGGVWLAEDLAQTVGAPVRTSATTTDGTEIAFAGIYSYPRDGRSPVLSYSIISPVPAVGRFDACWVQIWPENSELAGLLTLPVLSNDPGNLPQIQQLNTTLGLRFDAATRLARLPIWPLTGVAALIGYVLGFALIRTRRLELASALHAGLDKPTLIMQTSVETAMWSVLGAGLLLPALWRYSTIDNPDLSWPVFCPAARVVLLALISVLLGALTATFLTRESHLFRYFKNR